MSSRFALLLALALLVVWPTAAVAQFDVGVGPPDQFSRLGPIADDRLAVEYGERLLRGKGFVEVAERARHGGKLPASVGFRYHHLVIGLPIWTWGGEYCAYLASRREPISRTTAAQLLGVPEVTLRPPLFYRVPMGLIGYPLVIISVIFARLVPLSQRAVQAYRDSFEAGGEGERPTMDSDAVREFIARVLADERGRRSQRLRSPSDSCGTSS